MSARSHFRILGIPVRVEPLFLIVALFFGFQYESLELVAAWAVVVFVSILVHELGHALTLKAFGLPSSIVLHGFGGVTVSRRRLSRGRSIAVSLAGSLTALVLLGLPARALDLSDWWYEQGLFVRGLVTFGAFVNIWWSIANLLPIRPLDGGNVATELFGVARARRLSVAFAAVGGVYAYSQGERVAALFALMLGLLNISEIRAEKRGGTVPVFDVEAPDVATGGAARRRATNLRAVPPMAPAAPDASGTPSLADAEASAWSALREGHVGRAARAVAAHAQDGAINPFLRASLALASGRDDLADELFERAYTANRGGPPNLVPATLLAEHGRAVAVANRLVNGSVGATDAATNLQTHLHYAGRYEQAAEVGELVFAAGAQSPAQTAFEVACSWAQAGDGAEAVRWIETAIDSGFTAGRLLDGEPDLAAARAHRGWPAVRARLP